MKIVFMGTPAFAEASLRALLEDGQNVVAVFTQPDKPKDRGMQCVPSPVKVLAQEHGIPVHQPHTLRDGEATRLLREIAPDLLIVVSYGRILPDDFIALPPLGCINIHGSLLPKYRGPSPIQTAVLCGDRITGVSAQFIKPEVDTGDVIASQETEIGEFETSGELFERLKLLGAELLVETVHKIADGTAERIPQDERDVSYTKKLDKSMSPIDWTRTPREIVKQICGLNPWPVATTVLGGANLRIFAAEYTETSTKKAPGTVVCADKRGIEVACGGEKTLRITELQPAGKKRMSAAAYLLGHPIKADA